MDPRQPPQHPFSRNTASPYGRSPFPPSANQATFSTSSHPPSSTPSYAEHQRRPSDPPYGSQQRTYSQDGPVSAGSTHSRHQSASSIGYGSATRGMPPPSSPQQQTPHTYGPPPPRPPPVSVGPPTAFPASRELPSLGSIGRPSSTTNSSMSISSMLGGPPALREQPPQYTSPVSTSASQPMYPGPAHVSPRLAATGADYAPFRRPQTPEQRAYEPRDQRANSAGSPPGMANFGTPDARRYGTPQTYQRPPADERRDQPPARVPNTAIPARPDSQPSFNAPPPRVSDRAPAHSESLFGRREPARPESVGRPDPAYQRQAEYEERQSAIYAYEQRARQEREREAVVQRDMREREQREQQMERERVINERNVTLQQEYAHQLTQRNPQTAYSRPSEPREQPSWMRPGYEPPPRPAYEPIPEQDRESPRLPTNGHGYPETTTPQYGSHPAYAPSETRYQTHAASAMPSHLTSIPASQYETSIQERQRLHQHEHQRQQNMYGGPPQPGPYQSQDSPTRRTMEESQQMQQQRTFLGVGEINRKGRVSPLPQAVQGAQGQQSGPAHEPGIKSEFGRMFSGIGSGVSAMGAPSPVTAGAQGMPFSNPGSMRRDDLDQDSPVENGRGIHRTASRGGRRRKLKDEDSRDDESSNGRTTPSGRGKRAKTTHHHHGGHHHQHLGYAYYKSVLKPARRSTSDKDDRGFASTPEPLPRFEGQENCTFTVKVPKVYLGDVSREEITRRRAVWGTDVYTDDSDVVAACIHQGWFRGAWNKDVDVELLDLEIAGTNGAVNGKDYENDILTEPPRRGPMHVPKKKDLHVTVLVLPALEKYSSTTKFGIRSREWGGRQEGYQGVHDGLSFMIMSVQWVDGVDSNEGRSGELRRTIMAEALDNTEMEAEDAWGELLVSGNGANGPETHAEESFERGGAGMDGVGMTGDIKGVGTKSWWKKSNEVPQEAEKEPEVEKVVDQDREIERVTERMIENANATSALDGGKENEAITVERSGDEVTAVA
ncbi:hypothetical protein D0Z07_8237 [Hyphodiscus hymeniophilus]|uniref:Rxt3-domain-containing protein n=1 Tax=Hyphodiscus hymeniophilus TaxID=353542 RepID=A0A9P6VE48_9HELO|nr:hypothetical protein D0Z07_8237 [Hyphodiscus hymeniophilus]